jgi:hypothetical protein
MGEGARGGAMFMKLAIPCPLPGEKSLYLFVGKRLRRPERLMGARSGVDRSSGGGGGGGGDPSSTIGATSTS